MADRPFSQFTSEAVRELQGLARRQGPVPLDERELPAPSLSNIQFPQEAGTFGRQMSQAEARSRFIAEQIRERESRDPSRLGVAEPTLSPMDVLGLAQTGGALASAAGRAGLGALSSLARTAPRRATNMRAELQEIARRKLEAGRLSEPVRRDLRGGVGEGHYGPYQPWFMAEEGFVGRNPKGRFYSHPPNTPPSAWSGPEMERAARERGFIVRREGGSLPSDRERIYIEGHVDDTFMSNPAATAMPPLPPGTLPSYARERGDSIMGLQGQTTAGTHVMEGDIQGLQRLMRRYHQQRTGPAYRTEGKATYHRDAIENLLERARGPKTQGNFPIRTTDPDQLPLSNRAQRLRQAELRPWKQSLAPGEGQELQGWVRAILEEQDPDQARRMIRDLVRPKAPPRATSDPYSEGQGFWQEHLESPPDEWF